MISVVFRVPCSALLPIHATRADDVNLQESPGESRRVRELSNAEVLTVQLMVN